MIGTSVLSTRRGRSPSPSEERRHAVKRQKSISTCFDGLHVEKEDTDQSSDHVDGALTKYLDTGSHIVHSCLDRGVDIVQHGVEFIKDHTTCLQPQQSEDVAELPELAVSTVRIPNPDTSGQLVDFGMKFGTTQLDNGYQHSVLEVEDGSLAHQLKIRNGDNIHRINGSVLLDCEHHMVVNKFYHITEEFKLTLMRLSEDVVDGDDDDDDDTDTVNVYTFLEIEVKIELKDDVVTVEIIAELERQFIKDDLPKLGHNRKVTKHYVCTASSDSTSILSMTRSTLNIVPAHREDEGGQWMVHRYRVLWPMKFEAIKDDIKYPHHALVLYNATYKKCLSTTGSKQLICTGMNKKYLPKLKTIDNHVFFTRKWVEGTDHIVFESAKYRDFYLAQSGKGVLLMEYKDSDNLGPNTKFKFHTDVH